MQAGFNSEINLNHKLSNVGHESVPADTDGASAAVWRALHMSALLISVPPPEPGKPCPHVDLRRSRLLTGHGFVIVRLVRHGIAHSCTKQVGHRAAFEPHWQPDVVSAFED